MSSIIFMKLKRVQCLVFHIKNVNFLKAFKISIYQFKNLFLFGSLLICGENFNIIPPILSVRNPQNSVDLILNQERYFQFNHRCRPA